MQPTDRIDDPEIVLRRLQNGDEMVPDMDSGEFSVAAKHFMDRDKKPSVDRLGLLNKPEDAIAKFPDDGLADLLVKDVRAIDDPEAHEFDVVADPNPATDPDNHAHCLVTSEPPVEKDKRYRRVRLSLASIAKVRLPPRSARR